MTDLRAGDGTGHPHETLTAGALPTGTPSTGSLAAR